MIELYGKFSTQAKMFSLMLIIFLFCSSHEIGANNYYNPIVDSKNNIYLTDIDYGLMTGAFLLTNDRTSEDIVNKGLGVIYAVKTPRKISIIRKKKDFINGLRLSPDYKKITFLQRNDIISNESNLIEFDLNTKNEKILLSGTILEYQWSPDGSHIAYVLGKYGESGGPTVTGVWLYDMGKNQKIRIADNAIDLQWYLPDYLYIIDTKISYQKKTIRKKTKKYFVNEGSLGAEDLDGYQYSPNDQYYLRLSDEKLVTHLSNPTDIHKILEFDLCNSMAQDCMSRFKVKDIFANPENIIWEKIRLIGNNIIIVPRRNGEDEINSIHNIGWDQQLRMINGKIIGADCGMKKFVILNNKNFEIRTIP